MDLFKKMSMKMADSLDWNCKNVVKRKKGDTKRVHKQARAKLKRADKQVDQDVINYWDEPINEKIKKF